MKKSLLTLMAALTFTSVSSSALADPCVGCGVAAPVVSLVQVAQPVQAPEAPAVTPAPAPGAVVAAPGTVTELKNNILNGLMNFVLLGLNTALGFLVMAARRYMSNRTTLVKNQAFRELLQVVSDLAFQKVCDLQNTVVDALKAANGDGRLTTDQIQAVKATAMREIWKALTPEQQKQLSDAVGNAEQAMLQLIGPAIEAALSNMLQRGPVPKPNQARLEFAQTRVGLI